MLECRRAPLRLAEPLASSTLVLASGARGVCSDRGEPGPPKGRLVLSCSAPEGHWAPHRVKGEKSLLRSRRCVQGRRAGSSVEQRGAKRDTCAFQCCRGRAVVAGLQTTQPRPVPRPGTGRGRRRWHRGGGGGGRRRKPLGEAGARSPWASAPWTQAGLSPRLVRVMQPPERGTVWLASLLRTGWEEGKSN